MSFTDIDYSNVLFFQIIEDEFVLYTTRTAITDDNAIDCAQSWANKEGTPIIMYRNVEDCDEIYKLFKVVYEEGLPRFARNIRVMYNMRFTKFIYTGEKPSFVWAENTNVLRTM